MQRTFALFLVLSGALLCSTAFAESPLTIDKGDSLTAFEADDAGAALSEKPLLRAKRSNGRWTTQQIIECIFAIFLPPVAVIIHGGHEWVLHLIINIVLWVLGWIPGTIHALWYCFFR